MRSNQITHYKQSELLALLYTKASIIEIAHSLLLTEAQATRAICAIYKRAKVANRVELLAVEIAHLRERKDRAA